MFGVRVIFYIISWVHQFNYSIYTLCLGLGLGFFLSLSCYKYKWSPWQIVSYDFLYTHFGRPVYLVDMSAVSTLSTCQPCRPVYLVNLSSCLPYNLSTSLIYTIRNGVSDLNPIINTVWGGLFLFPSCRSVVLPGHSMSKSELSTWKTCCLILVK